MRFEYKFVLDYLTVDQIETKLNLHPAGFREAFPQRRITSIYFDDVRFSAAIDNINGSPNRIKYRIRWYDDFTFPLKVRLEQKIKKGLPGYKNVEKKMFSSREDLNTFINEINLQPVCVVSYLRNYLVSFSGGIRATIDKDIKYKKTIDDLFWVNDPKPILEIKCALDQLAELESVVDALKLRRHKNSKYLNSLIALYK